MNLTQAAPFLYLKLPLSSLLREHESTYGVWGLSYSITSDRVFLALRGPGSVRSVNVNAGRSGFPCLEPDPYRCEEPNGFVRGVCFIPDEKGGILNGSGGGALLLSTSEHIDGREGEWLVCVALTKKHSVVESDAWNVTHRIPSEDRGGPMFFGAIGYDSQSEGAIVVCGEFGARYLKVIRITPNGQIVQLSRIPMPPGTLSFAVRATPLTCNAIDERHQLATIQRDETVRLHILELKHHSALHEICRVTLLNPYRALWVGDRLFVCYRPNSDTCHSVVELKVEQNPDCEDGNRHDSFEFENIPRAERDNKKQIIYPIRTQLNFENAVINEWCAVGDTSFAIHDMKSRALFIYSLIE